MFISQNYQGQLSTGIRNREIQVLRATVKSYNGCESVKMSKRLGNFQHA
jgi:hypothetical protein